jgi:hypothetical protein
MSTATTPSSTKGRGKNAKGTNGHNRPAEPSGLESDGASRQQVSAEDIARRAYELYEEEGRQDGKDVDYWLRAEAELTRRSR